MKIVIAPDSFKESLSALDVAKAIEAGFKEIYPEATYVKIPMADGGEGTVESMIDATGGQLIKTQVTGPLGQPVDAFWGLTGDGEGAVIEMAAASGLHHVPPALRNPLNTTSFGTGELILHALDHGVKQIILGIGGSATNDGGVGMLQALGVSFLDVHGQELAHRGEALTQLHRIETDKLDARLASVTMTVACDVNNPLCGPSGASAVFGPQKGASAEIVATLDAALRHYGELVESLVGYPVISVAGAGAAGGMGAALLGLLGAQLRPGVEIVTEALGLEEQLIDADLVITGEGKLDSQTITGKTPIGVARVAKRHQRKVIAVAGMLAEDHSVIYAEGIDAAFAVVQGVHSLEKTLADAERNIRVTARNIARLWQMAN